MQNKRILDGDRLRRVILRMATNVVDLYPDLDEVMLVGIREGGDLIAERMAREIELLEGRVVRVGVLDVILYRDDLEALDPRMAIVKPTKFPSQINGQKLVLVTDTLGTGRTVRAAFDALSDFGRPASVRIATLIDRGKQAREYPVYADIIGKSWQNEGEVRVDLAERGQEDGVYATTEKEGGLP